MTVELESSVDSQIYVGSFSQPRAKEVHHVRHSILGFKRHALLVFDPGGFSQLLLELTVLEETFSYRTPCSLLFLLANQFYFDLK